jgi:fructose-bisphosphate aldolase, class I
MNTQQFERMKNAKGFIAALDQSGGSTPKALGLYGIPKESYHNDDEMFTLIHEMRTRMITSPAFTSERILAAILFKNTVNRTIEDLYTADYLWEKKGIIPILKVDLGLQDLADGVQMMKPITDLDETLALAKERHIFGTKMRSVIKAADPKGIKAIVEQQFEIGKQIIAAGLVPILEPEVDINIPDKAEAEDLMLAEVKEQLAKLPADAQLMFKFTIPTKADLYADLMKDPHVVRIVALSGGYTREDANNRLSQNHGMIASFSRALAEGLSVNQSDEEFNKVLDTSIQGIYDASIA